MPPQGYLVIGGLGANAACAALGLPTISMFLRRHKIASAVVLVGFNAWIWPHIYLKES